MFFWLAIIALVVWLFLWPAKEKPQTALTLPVAAPVFVAPKPEDSASVLLRMRKQLAADEKLTPELKAAFDAIGSALKDGGAA